MAGLQQTTKPFAWSFSRLKNFESCPKKHYHADIAKDVKEEENDTLLYGNLVHKSLADRIGKGKELPVTLRELEPWAVKMLAMKEVGADLLVEQKLAITEDFRPAEFFGRGVWFRSIADVLAVQGPVAITVDWKTGKILDDSQQLALTAACIFARYPTVSRIRTQYVWLKDDATTTHDFARDDMVAMWAGIWPRIMSLKHAHNTGEYPPKPGGLCRRYCPVTQCIHNGANQ